MRNESAIEKVAAVIVNWKQPALTQRCISSVLSGSVIPSTIVIVENETHDFSTSFMRTCIESDHDGVRIIRICSEVNRGYAGGVNLGIEVALQMQVECVVLINNDVVVDYDCIERLFSTWKESKVAIVGGRCLNEARDRDVGFARSWPSAIWGQGVIPKGKENEPFRADIIDGALWLVSRCCLEASMEHRGFFLDPLYFLYWEDADLCMFARQMGMQCLFDGKATARHNVAASSGGTNNAKGLYYQSRNVILFTCRWSSSMVVMLYLFVVLLNRIASFAKHLVNMRFVQAGAVLRGVWHGLFGVRWKSL
jgi:GT2 family glycosyltransferase